MQFTSSPRIPVYNGTAAAMGTLTGMVAGDLYYTTDTKLLYTYDGATWNNVLSGVTQDCTLVGSTTLTGTATSISFTSIASGYKSFLIQIECAGLTSDGNACIRCNNDSGNNYINRAITCEGAPASATGRTDGIDFHSSSVGLLQASFGAHIHLSNKASLQKFTTSICNCRTNAISIFNGGCWNNTSDEINRIDLISSANMPVGTRFTVWGFK